MQEITVHEKFSAPGPRCQPLAFDGTSLWTGSWETNKIYELDPKSGATRSEFEAPGPPFGLATFNGELRAVISHGEDEDRYLYRFVPGEGFDLASKTACPDLTGSHIVAHGGELYLAQLHFRRIAVLAPDGSTQRLIKLPSQIGGMGLRGGKLHVIATDDDFDELRFAQLDGDPAAPHVLEIAPLPEVARALVFDGNAWWTSYREAGEIVSFKV